MPTWNTPQSQDLFQALLRLRNLAEVKKFLRDLLTPAEITEFSRRWKAAQMLNQGISYTKIVKQTGLSSTTVARVQRWLTKGAGGYKLILKRMAHHSHPLPRTRLKEV